MIIQNDDIGKRLDRYLGEVTEYTRSKIQKMIESENVLVNDKKTKSSYILKENDCITITEYLEETDILPENIPLDIYYEDEDLIVVINLVVWLFILLQEIIVRHLSMHFYIILLI